MQDVYIVGSSGFACEVTEYVESESDFNIKGYFDLSQADYEKYSFDAPFLGSEDSFRFCGGEAIILAVSDVKVRKSIYEKLYEKGCSFPPIVHSSSFVSSRAKLGEGSILCPFVTVTANVEIGKNFQANIYSYVAHDCKIGDNVTFAPSVKCNGNVVIEDNVYIGTGAIIFQGRTGKPLVIGEGATIAAGSVVTKSVPGKKVVFGNPAIEFTKENIKRRS